MRRPFTQLALALGLFGFAGSLGASEPLTNATVRELARRGLAPATIILKIRQSASRFDTSPEALAALRGEGIDDSVLRAMLEASGEPGTLAVNG